MQRADALVFHPTPSFSSLSPISMAFTGDDEPGMQRVNAHIFHSFPADSPFSLAEADAPIPTQILEDRDFAGFGERLTPRPRPEAPAASASWEWDFGDPVVQERFWDRSDTRGTNNTVESAASGESRGGEKKGRKGLLRKLSKMSLSLFKS
ncbi:hypothetical protein HK104_006175 [Borealophlyctis nickersoniae]|nr:hypothetical protein HK104_006175 [Borealophlyctis nickersoniae]